jgi:PAS domain S-box-containing protein
MGKDQTGFSLKSISRPQTREPKLELADAEAMLQVLADVFLREKALGSLVAAEPTAMENSSSDSSWPARPEISDSFSEEDRYRTLVDQLPAVVFMASLDKGIGNAYVSPQIEAVLGFSQSEWIQDPIRWYQRIHPDDKARWSTEAAEMFLSGTTLKSAYRVIARDGRVVWFQCEAKMIRREDGRPSAIHGVGFDVTELKESEAALSEKHGQLQLLKDIATKANQAMNVEEAMQFAVDRVCEFTGWPLGHVCLASPDRAQLVSSNIWSGASERRFQTFREASEMSGESLGEDLTGGVFANARPAWSREVGGDPKFSRRAAAERAGIKSAFAFPVTSGSGVVAVLEFFSEVSAEPGDVVVELMAHVGAQLGQIVERVRVQEKLSHDAFHDSLTALPNRVLFLERLDRAMARSKRNEDYHFAVLLIDIDRFKIVNDSLGHAAGDELILQVSKRVLRALRIDDVVARPAGSSGARWKSKDDTLARLGSDEFSVLLDDIQDPSDGIRVAERIQDAFAEPFAICGQEIFTTVSIGIAAKSAHTAAADVVRDADSAMYRAKLRGKARCEVFDQAMHEHSVNRLKLETDLRKALEREEFRVHYQPIVALRTGRISGFEALVRWQRSDGRFVAPGEFIGVAEEMGLIVGIGKWVLRTACEQAHRWHLENPQEIPLTMSVNISARQFVQDDLVAQVAEIIRETKVEPSAIKLEITESVTMGDAERTIRVVNELKKLGLRFSIDDFGTGYSSLSYLRRFPMDTLKIDRSFVSNLDKDAEKREIARTIVGLARNLGMDVVAEGTETLEEVNFLRTLDCEYAQGYFFSRPVDAQKADVLVAERRAFDPVAAGQAAPLRS